jgi:ADP-heptose:LPS heptosyltransferase
MTCPGIGDTVWLFMKLVNQKERFHWKIGDGTPQRGHQIFELFPQLVESFEYIPQSGYKKVKRNAFSGKWSQAPERFYLEANTWLEEGKRIEKFLPDLPTSFKLEYASTKEEHDKARDLLLKDDCNYRSAIHSYIGIYTSAYSNARHWGGWEAKEWLELIKLIQDYNKKYKFVFIGADYDIGVSQEVMYQMKKDSYINTIGQPLPVVIEILKRLDCFIGFPSGLSIIHETLAAKQTVMFYPKHLTKLINAWPDPERIANGSYKGCLFCEPKQIFDWMINNNKI